jgi:hypothetical protein
MAVGVRFTDDSQLLFWPEEIEETTSSLRPWCVPCSARLSCRGLFVQSF